VDTGTADDIGTIKDTGMIEDTGTVEDTGTAEDGNNPKSSYGSAGSDSTGSTLQDDEAADQTKHQNLYIYPDAIQKGKGSFVYT